MEKIKLGFSEIFKEYENGKNYNARLGLYDQVKRNESFYIGNQWEGVNAPNLPKPTLNILKRVVSYFISMLVSDDVTARVSPFSGQIQQQHKQLFDAVANEFTSIIEQNKLKSLNRQLLRDGAVCGDGCLYAWFDPGEKTENLTDGVIKTELLQNTDVYFGNPNISDVQKQPYLLIVSRRALSGLQENCSEEIVPDEQISSVAEDEKYVTCVRKLYKNNGVVWVTEICKSCVLVKPKPLGYKLYPIVWFNWEKVKNSYHGQSCMTPVIQNQIDINRLFAMCIKQVRDGAFPKIVYSKSLLPNGWDNTVGKAIGVNGDVDRAVMRPTSVSEMSNQVLSMISLLINYTKETMGASDAALGNVAPQNTSAIIALQKSSAMPLELQRLDFYQAVEDYIRVFLDMISVNYGKRFVDITNENGDVETAVIDYDALRDMQLKVNVDVGATTYWSELSGIATLDNLFAKGVFTDVSTYIESLPNGVLPNKEGILKAVKEAQKMPAMQAENVGG